MSRKNLKIGLIGCGYMGNYYAHMSGTNGFEITVCCDPSVEKLAEFCQKWKIPERSTNWLEILKNRDSLNLDGIINCSVDSLHADVFEYCIKESIPLLSEKPPALPLKLLQKLTTELGIEKFCGSKFMINFSKRCLPAVASACDFINQGELGKIQRIELHYRQGWLINNDFGDWHTTSTWFWRLTDAFSHYGILGDLGSHLLDLAVLFGGSVESLGALLTTYPKDPDELNGFKLSSPDDAVCSLKFKSGASALVSATRALPGEVDGLEVTISGTAGSIRILPEQSRKSFKIFRCKGPENLKGWDSVESNVPVKKNFEYFVLLLEGRHENLFKLYDKPPGIPEAAINQILIEAAVESSGSGKVVIVDDLINERLGAEWLWLNKRM